MFKESAEFFYIKYIKVPALVAKKKCLQRFANRHDYDIMKVAKFMGNSDYLANTNMFVNYL